MASLGNCVTDEESVQPYVSLFLISGNWAHEHVGIRSWCCSDSEVHLTEDEAAVQQDPPDQEHFQL